jgi:hypothetical protein
MQHLDEDLATAIARLIDQRKAAFEQSGIVAGLRSAAGSVERCSIVSASRRPASLLPRPFFL